MPCLIKQDMHHTCCASCHVYVMVVYYVVCFFPVLLLRVGSDNVAFVRTRSATSVCLLHGLVLLPCRQDDHTLEITSIFALLVVRSTWHAALPTTCYIMPPLLPCQPLTFSPVLANPCLAMLPLLLSPSYSVVSCRWRWRLLHVGLCLCWDITISLI